MTTARPRYKETEFRSQELPQLFDRQPPVALEAEMSLLGSMIIAGTTNRNLLGEVIQIVKGPEDFSRPSHGAIFQAISKLYDSHGTLDTVQLIQLLRDGGKLEEVGGTDYLIQLAESVPTAENAPYYAQIVRDKSKLRQLIFAAGQVLRDAYETSEPASSVIDRAEQSIFKIAQDNTAADPTKLSELVNETYTLLSRRAEDGRTISGQSTGLNRLDEMLSGLQNGDMVILAARPSMGKTALALNIAEHIAVTNRQAAAFFSLEMSRQQLAQRLLSSRAGVDAQKMRRNMLSEGDFRNLQDACAELYEAPMFIDDTPSISILELRAKCRRLKSQHDIKAVFVDYLQLMRSPGAQSREQEVAEISRGIKALGRELEVPVICLSQLNRNPEGRESKIPMLSDLRESGSIEQDADVVMMLHREDYYHKDPAWAEANPDKVGVSDLIVAKQRNGPTGMVKLSFHGATTSFHDLAPGYEQSYS